MRNKNIQPGDEEIIAFLNDWLINSFFTHTNKKIVVRELIRRYIQSKLTIGRIRGIIENQRKKIEEIEIILEEYKEKDTDYAPEFYHKIKKVLERGK